MRKYSQWINTPLVFFYITKTRCEFPKENGVGIQSNILLVKWKPIQLNELRPKKCKLVMLVFLIKWFCDFVQKTNLQNILITVMFTQVVLHSTKNIVLIYYKKKSVLESQCIFNDLEEYLSNFFSKDQLIRYQISIVWLSITKKMTNRNFEPYTYIAENFYLLSVFCWH